METLIVVCHRGALERTTERQRRAMEEDLRAYSVKEAAKLLSVSEYQVRRLVWQGELRAKRCGTRVLVPATAIREYLDAPEPLPRKEKAAKVPPPL